MMKKIGVLLVAWMSFSCFSQQHEDRIPLNYKEFKAHILGKKVQLIDLRTDVEYNAGFIETAIQMNFLETATFLKQIESLDKEQPVYIYCRSGNRSRSASKVLLKKGFAKVYDFTGGYTSWVKNNPN